MAYTAALATMALLKTNDEIQPVTMNPVVTDQIQFSLTSSNSEARKPLETFVADCFRSAYGAQLNHFLPLLLAMERNENTAAVLGLNPASCGELFLESYLSAPIEQVAAEALQTPVVRDQLIEVGNLASFKGGHSLLLFAIMAYMLAAARYRWMVFTATPQVYKLIKRFNYTPIVIADANAEFLGDQAQDWGSYYDCEPKIMLLDIARAVAVGQATTRVKNLYDQHHATINSLAEQLRDFHRLNRCCDE